VFERSGGLGKLNAVVQNAKRSFFSLRMYHGPVDHQLRTIYFRGLVSQLFMIAAS